MEPQELDIHQLLHIKLVPVDIEEQQEELDPANKVKEDNYKEVKCKEANCMEVSNKEVNSKEASKEANNKEDNKMVQLQGMAQVMEAQVHTEEDHEIFDQ